MKAVTIKDIARALNISHSTVSLALRDSPKLPEATIQKVKAIARTLNYRPNPMAKSLVGGKTNVIGVITSTLDDHYHVKALAGAETFLNAHGYSVMLYLTHGQPENTMSFANDIISRRVDGALIFCSQFLRDQEAMNRLSQENIPVSAYGSSANNVDSVSNDADKNVRLIIKHLSELGHRRIAMVDSLSATWRSRVFQPALEEYGLEFHPEFLSRLVDVNAMATSARRARETLMSHKESPTAIIAFNDEFGVYLLKESLDAGYQVPGDISLVGINDFWYSAMTPVPLTSLYLPSTDIGECCAKNLITRIQHPDTPIQTQKTPGALTIRSSTAPPAN